MATHGLHMIDLNLFTPNKVWTVDDADHPEWFVLALFLLYQKLRGVRTLYLGSSIHIRYSVLPVHEERKIDNMIERLMDGEESSAAIERADGKGRA